jgi:hypothetical protein
VTDGGRMANSLLKTLLANRSSRLVAEKRRCGYRTIVS